MLTELQGEQEKLNSTTKELIEEHNRKQKHIDVSCSNPNAMNLRKKRNMFSYFNKLFNRTWSVWGSSVEYQWYLSTLLCFTFLFLSSLNSIYWCLYLTGLVHVCWQTARGQSWQRTGCNGNRCGMKTLSRDISLLIVCWIVWQQASLSGRFYLPERGAASLKNYLTLLFSFFNLYMIFQLAFSYRCWWK